jgi:transposase-like protein
MNPEQGFLPLKDSLHVLCRPDRNPENHIHDEYHRRLEPPVQANYRNKPSFTNDDSLRKMLYLASKKLVKYWTCRRQNWDMVLNQMNIMFPARPVG